MTQIQYSATINLAGLEQIKKDTGVKINLKHALVLDLFRKFRDYPKVEKIIHDGEEYVWISYQAVIDRLPILEITGTKPIYRLFIGLVEAGLLKKYTCKVNNKTYFRAGENLYKLDYKLSRTEKSEGRTEKSTTTLGRTQKSSEVGLKSPQGGDSKVLRGRTEKSDNAISKDYAISNYSLSNKQTNTPILQEPESSPQPEQVVVLENDLDGVEYNPSNNNLDSQVYEPLDLQSKPCEVPIDINNQNEYKKPAELKTDSKDELIFKLIRLGFEKHETLRVFNSYTESKILDYIELTEMNESVGNKKAFFSSAILNNYDLSKVYQRRQAISEAEARNKMLEREAREREQRIAREELEKENRKNIVERFLEAKGEQELQKLYLLEFQIAKQQPKNFFYPSFVKRYAGRNKEELNNLIFSNGYLKTMVEGRLLNMSF